MAKKITIYYTVNSFCSKTIEVADDFQIKGKNAKGVYKELCEKLPEESLNDIEDEEEGDREVNLDQFVEVDGVEVLDEIKGIKESYKKIKETFKFK